MQTFYKGFKEEVKDELYKVDRLDSLDKYIAIAIRIDDRQYVRKQQRKGKDNLSQAYRSNDKKKRHYYSTVYRTYVEPMDTSAIQRSLGLVKQGKADIVYFNYI